MVMSKRWSVHLRGSSIGAVGSLGADAGGLRGGIVAVIADVPLVHILLGQLMEGIRKRSYAKYKACGWIVKVLGSHTDQGICKGSLCVLTWGQYFLCHSWNGQRMYIKRENGTSWDIARDSAESENSHLCGTRWAPVVRKADPTLSFRSPPIKTRIQVRTCRSWKKWEAHSL